MAMVSMLPASTSNVGGSELNIHYGASSPSATSGLWVARDSVPPAVALSGGLVFDSAYYTTLASIAYTPSTMYVDNYYATDVGGGVYNGVYYFIGHTPSGGGARFRLFSYDLSTHVYTNLGSTFTGYAGAGSYGSEYGSAALCDGRLVVVTYSTFDSDSSNGGRKSNDLYIIDLETMTYTTYDDAGPYWFAGCRAWADEVNHFVWVGPTDEGRDETSGNGYIRKIDPLSGTYTACSIPSQINTSTYNKAPGPICATDSGVYIFGASYGTSNAARQAYVSTNLGSSWTAKSTRWPSDAGLAMCAIWMGGRDIFVFCSHGNVDDPTYLYRYNMDTDTYTLLSDSIPTLAATGNYAEGNFDFPNGANTLSLAVVGNIAYYVTNQVRPDTVMNPIRITFELAYPYPEGALVIALSNTKNRATLSDENPIIETGVSAVYEYTNGELAPQTAYVYDVDGGWMQI